MRAPPTPLTWPPPPTRPDRAAGPGSRGGSRPESGAQPSGRTEPVGSAALSLAAVSTRMLIILALICGLAVLVAFAIQAIQIF